MTHIPDIDLNRLFYQLRQEPYAVVKSVDALVYSKGGDIDIFCYDKSNIAKLIIAFASPYLDSGYRIGVTEKTPTHAYVDLLVEEEIVLRFDLYESLPGYKKINLKPHYVASVIENARCEERACDGETYSVKYASELDDLILRYVEYIEWYEQRPDKIKHLAFIESRLTSPELQKQMLDKLHYYTAFPFPAVSEPLTLKLVKKRVRKQLERVRNLDKTDVDTAIRHGRYLFEKRLKKIKKKLSRFK